MQYAPLSICLQPRCILLSTHSFQVLKPSTFLHPDPCAPEEMEHPIEGPLSGLGGAASADAINRRAQERPAAILKESFMANSKAPNGDFAARKVYIRIR